MSAKFTGTFKRGYKRLDEEVRQRVERIIEMLLYSDDPRKEGHALHGSWEGCYSYEIGLKYRLIYKVELEKGDRVSDSRHSQNLLRFLSLDSKH